MSQLDLFTPAPAPANDGWEDWDWPADPVDPADRDAQLVRLGLRYYQREGVRAAFEAWTRSEHPDRSTLLVAATGLGKTQMFGAAAALWDSSVNGSDKVLVLAHRSELVEQARARLEQLTGEYVEVEQADWRASGRSRIVVASIDTIKQKRRLERFGAAHFGLIIIDEAHHYLAPTYRRPLDYFRDAKLLGVTATPDRGDARALGQLFDSVCYVVDIAAGIEMGYLVPVRGRQCILDGLDLDGIAVQKGDLVASQLDDAMVTHVEGVVQKTSELEPDRAGILFFPGVKTAELAAERLNALRPGSAAFISGTTPDDERRSIVRAFKERRIQYLANCMVATEGFDAPSASMIVIARPTKKRGLYAQMVGRGTRVLPGIVEGYDGPENAALRRTLIAQSAKPDMVILDVVGVGSKHSLVGPEDLLGGEYSEAEVAQAKKLSKANPGRDTREYLTQARRELQALAQSLGGRRDVRAAVSTFDPFAAFGVSISDEERYSSFATPAARWQLAVLKRKGVDDRDLAGLTRRAANKLLKACDERQKAGLCTFKQLKQLARRGVTETAIPFAVANRALDYIVSHGWGRAKSFDPHQLHDIIQKGTHHT